MMFDIFKKKEGKYFFLPAIILLFIIIPFVSAGFFDKVFELTGRATSATTTVTITMGATTLDNISTISDVSPSEANVTWVFFNFTAGSSSVGNIDDSTARANITKAGFTTRNNNSCILDRDLNTTHARYNCTIGMWYFDGNGTWTITASVRDNSSNIGNKSSVLSFNTLTSIKMSPTALTFPTISPGDTNITSNNDPIIVNNTGNINVALGNISVNATNLVGAADPAYWINAINFSVNVNNGGTPPAECSKNVTMANATTKRISTTTLPAGNTSAGSGQESLYFCLYSTSTSISTQTYDTSTQGAWTIAILTP